MQATNRTVVFFLQRCVRTVLNISTRSGPGVAPDGGSATPQPCEGVYIGDLTIDAAELANYSVFAPGIARSRFNRVAINNALRVGISAGFGWCNYFEGMRFTRNTIGLHTYNSGNNIDIVDSIFEANFDVGIYVSGGIQVSIRGNTLESNGVAINVVAAGGVSITSNYFEANPDPTIYKNGASGLVLHPAPTAAGSKVAPALLMHTDILLNGATTLHDGTSAFADTDFVWYYGLGYCPSAVDIRSNTHVGRNSTMARLSFNLTRSFHLPEHRFFATSVSSGVCRLCGRCRTREQLIRRSERSLPSAC